MASVSPFDPHVERSDGENLGAEITELCAYIYAATHRLLTLIREFVNELHAKREVTYYYDHDGCLVIKARIPADQGELIVKALEMAMEASSVAEEESEPVAARRADALCEMAETYMNNSENSGSTADRYQVVVHVGSDSAREAHLENGPHVTAETSVARWYAGEQMDWEHAVSLLFN